MTSEDHIERLELMLEDGNDWDLSANDRAAITWALTMAQEAERMRRWNELTTVQSFLSCADDVKAEFFRASLRDSQLLKQAREENERLRAALASGNDAT